MRRCRPIFHRKLFIEIEVVFKLQYWRLIDVPLTFSSWGTLNHCSTRIRGDSSRGTLDKKCRFQCRRAFCEYFLGKLVPWVTDSHLRVPWSTFCWFSQIAWVRCRVTEPLGQNQKFRLRYALKKVLKTHNMETSTRFQWPSLSLTIWHGAHTWQFSDPRDLDLDNDRGKNLPPYITHRPLPTYQVSPRSDIFSLTLSEPNLVRVRRRAYYVSPVARHSLL